jgi:hypothetical protein
MSWLGLEMTVSDPSALLALAVRVLATRTDDAGALGLAASARTAYDDLSRASVPLIGQAGFDAMAGRAIHLAQRVHPCLAAMPPREPALEPFARVAACLGRQAPAVAAPAAAEVLAILTGLFVTFIGEPLTMRLLHQAWPDGFSGATEES